MWRYCQVAAIWKSTIRDLISMLVSRAIDVDWRGPTWTWKPSVWRSISNSIFLNLTLSLSVTHPLTLPHQSNASTDGHSHSPSPSLTLSASPSPTPAPTHSPSQPHRPSLSHPLTLSLTYAVSERNRRKKGESLYAFCNVISSCLFIYLFFSVLNL